MNENIIANLIKARAAQMPDLDVLTFEHNGQEEIRTYRQLWENGQHLAWALKERGIRKGDVFALLMQNHPEFVEAIIASAILGTVFVPIDSRSRGDKLAFMLRNAGCRGVICGDYALGGLLECADAVPDLDWIYVIGDGVAQGPNVGRSVHRLKDLLIGPVPDLPIAVENETEPMQIMYTSGTTGDPKGIVIPHARFGLVSTHGETVFGYRKGDRPYTGLSLTHGNAQFVTLASSLRMGLRAVFSRKFTKSRLWDIVRKYGCTTFSLLGGMATAIYAEPRRADDSNNPVRMVISAGMPSAIWQNFAQRFNLQILEFYGAMEGGMLVNPVGEGPVGSCGRVSPGQLAKVVDDEGREVPRGSPGELWFKWADGKPMSVNYVNDPEASRRKIADGWLRSGDVATMDSDGWVFYLYRKGSGIRRNGEFINPAIVEKVVVEHSAVSDAFVYGRPAENGAPGERDVVAAVVLVDRAEFVPADLFQWCRSRLEPNMNPSFIQVVDEIPKTASEKPQERFLLQMFDVESEHVFRENEEEAGKRRQAGHSRGWEDTR